MNKREAILCGIKQAVAAIDPTAELILFGSHARGDFHAESDWDVLLLTDKEVDYNYRSKIAHQILPVELRLGVSVGFIIRNKNEWKLMKQTPFYKEVQKDGEPIV